MSDNKEKKHQNGNAREYKTEDLIVYWYPSMCSHAAKCITLLPEVFDMQKRPWVNMNGASAIEIIRTIDKCPSGALRYSLPETSKVDPDLANGPGNIKNKATDLSTPVTIRAVKDGPLLVKGPVTLLDVDGAVLREANSMVLCRCGKSKNPPFCDGEHRFIKKDE
ncbi:MAG: (4Fe-4S)-binding protein [Anaerovoracaceae bacterium]|nr:hypothetical protein [Clostridiales bacterium]